MIQRCLCHGVACQGPPLAWLAKVGGGSRASAHRQLTWSRRMRDARSIFSHRLHL